MDEKMFKVSASDWEIEFEDENKLILKTVISEKIVTTLKDTIISLTHFDYNIDNLNLNSRIKTMTEIFEITNSTGDFKTEMSVSYQNMYVKSIIENSSTDSVSTRTIIFKKRSV